MSGFVNIAMSLAVLFAFILAAGGAFILVRRPRAERTKGLLMLAVAVVTLGNVWLLSAPLTP
ncbi:hypothetical protein KCG44_07985 [Pacificimonas sp. WHA3]|uniref:Uncharacterized protein n=1 Tax=Pacificimonas pallii TaxID=2827236 RepID=A0ABS6SEA7_9SPHN|nr:hypothetical protein [Pacificimonas pallii]MBV7256724.1 hypothetical protein [Pacificimonas pallii]